ncbi:MAG: hypothetical protein HYZ36_01905 [Pedosphaera parvula]|nr:hypothetical protein [Pedosphaera parvula]
MNKLSKEKLQQLILLGVGTLIAIGVLWALVINRQWGAIKETRGKISETEEKIATGQRWVGKKKEVDKGLEEIAKKLGDIEGGMASGDLYLWFDSLLKNFQIKHGKVRVPRISRPENIQVGLLPEFPYQAVKYTVQGSAYYHDLGKFVADFENEFPYMRIQNLELRPVSALDTTDPEKLEFSMQVVALVKPLEEEKSP